MEEKLIQFLNKNNGYIETKQFKEIGIPKIYIKDFMDKKILRKVSRGLYIDANKFEDEYYIFQNKYNKAIFSYNTAFHLLNMTERTPMEMEVTLLKNYHIYNHPEVKVHYVSKNKYELGIIEIDSPCGNKIKVYNKERSICDMIKSNDEFELELYNKILNNYMNSKDKDLNLLLEYARKLNIYDKVVSIMEVLMK